MESGRIRAIAAAAGLIALGAVCTSASAVGPNGVLYDGRTSQAREIKVVTDSRGVVKRGAFSVRTECSGRFKPFSADISFDKPLDRSTRRRFKESGNELDTDGTYSGRYKFEIEGKRRSKIKFKGELNVEIVFRKNDRKYTTCVAEDVAFKVKRSSRK